MKKQTEPESQSCPYCNHSQDNPCVLANEKTVIEGKEYSACCTNLNANKLKPKNKANKTTKKKNKN
jgi:hypothetical protein